MHIEWNKVTWYSKLLALALFVALPFIGFCLGVRYQKLATNQRFTTNNQQLTTNNQQTIRSIPIVCDRADIDCFERQDKYYRDRMSTSQSDTSTWKTYRNEKYGFEVYLDDDWMGYKVVSSDDAKTYHFCLPTREVYPDSGCGGDSYSGFASMFYIGAFSPVEWKERQGLSTGRSIYLSENRGVVFGYGLAQDTPSDLAFQRQEITQILSTFKFVK